MSDQPRDFPPGLWAITSYFNPMGYRTRRVNYRIFWEHLKVPLLTVEQGHQGKFELGRQDATSLLQIPSQDVMWQKERLLNLALSALPPDCHTVVWLDSDILFELEEWPQRAMEELERAVMVQLFSRAYYLPEGVDFSRPLAEQSYLQRRSTASGLRGGGLEQNALVPSLETLKAHGMATDYSNGHAWAMRREVLEREGFYEAMIVGGGDYVFLQAAIGQFEVVRESHGWTSPPSRQYQHYLRWANRFYNIVQGRVGLVPGDIFNLWHGELRNRQYLARHRILTAHDFDPNQDIAIDENGSLRWNSHKPALHQGVARVFSRSPGRRPPGPCRCRRGRDDHYRRPDRRRARTAAGPSSPLRASYRRLRALRKEPGRAVDPRSLRADGPPRPPTTWPSRRGVTRSPTRR